MSADKRSPLSEFSQSLASTIEQAGQSVVRVEARQRQAASGVLWSADGLVVTADHVVERDEGITVGLADGGTVSATLVGRDPDHDLAVLKLADARGGAAKLAKPSGARVGQVVIGVARPSGDGVQASWGIVSAIGGPVRTRRGGMLRGYLRTGVTMYPGFSGGALVDSDGNIIGVLSSQLGADAGLAVPTEVIAGVVTTLQQHGRVRRAFLGFRSQPQPLPAALAQKLGRAQENGLLVLSVESGSPAEQAGLLLGDIVVSFAGQPVQTPDDLQTVLTAERIGTAVTIGLLRGGEPTEVTITPAERQ